MRYADVEVVFLIVTIPQRNSTLHLPLNLTYLPSDPDGGVGTVNVSQCLRLSVSVSDSDLRQSPVTVSISGPTIPR